MLGPINCPSHLLMYSFRSYDPVTKRWGLARYKATETQIRERYDKWELVGPPEIRVIPKNLKAYFSPYR